MDGFKKGVVSLHSIPKKTVKSLAKQDDLSFEEALAIVAHQEQKIQEAKQAVYDEPVNRNDGDVVFPSIIGAGSVLFAGVPLGVIIHNENVFMASICASFVVFAGALLGFSSEFNHKLRRRLFPKRYKRNEFRYRVEQELRQGKVEYLHQVEQKTLDKTRNAVDVINDNLPAERVLYCANEGKFLIEPKPEMATLGKWDQLLARKTGVENAKNTIESIGNRKYVEA